MTDTERLDWLLDLLARKNLTVIHNKWTGFFLNSIDQHGEKRRRIAYAPATADWREMIDNGIASRDPDEMIRDAVQSWGSTSDASD